MYILVAGLMNLAISLAAPGVAGGWRGHVRRTGSAILLIVPAVLLAAFFVDPPRAPDRWLTSGGMLGLAIGVIAHLTASRRPAGKGPPPDSQ